MRRTTENGSQRRRTIPINTWFEQHLGMSRSYAGDVAPCFNCTEDDTLHENEFERTAFERLNIRAHDVVVAIEVRNASARRGQLQTGEQRAVKA